MSKTRLVLATFFVVALAFVVWAGDGGDAVVGLWRTAPSPDGAAIVKIVREGKTYHGTIVWLEKPLYGPGEERPGQPKVDLNNPDPKLRERPVLGLEILQGFRYAGGAKWKNGTIYDPSNGKTYKCKMWLDEPGTLKVRGYIGFSLLGRSETWQHVDHLPQAQKAEKPAGEASTS